MLAVRYLAPLAVALAACTLLTDVKGLSGTGAETPEASDAGPAEATTDVATELDAAREGDVMLGDGSDGGACDDLGLVAFYRFEEGAGDVVRDCSPYKNDGTLTAGAWVPGVHGGAVSLDGGWVAAGNADVYQLVGDITVAAFIRVDQFPDGLTDSTSGYIVGKAVGTSAGWRLATESNGTASFRLGLGGDSFLAATPAPVSALTWLHVAAVHRPGRITFYLNGAPVSTEYTDADVGIINAPAEVRIGARGDGKQGFAGAIDEVRIYNRALEDNEVHAIAER